MNILNKLKGGDLRSIGRADEVEKDILKNPNLFKDVFEELFSKNPVIRMRSADVLEKVSFKHPAYLQPHKSKLINKVSKTKQQEVRWHLAQMFSYLKLTRKEQNQIIKILTAWIGTEKSNIVKVFSIQTLADFAEENNELKPKVIKIIKEAMKSNTPSITGRGKKLLKELSS